MIDGRERHQGKGGHRHADDDGLQERTVGRGAEILEHQRRVIEHRVDADELLEHRQQDPDEEDLAAVAHERPRLLDQRGADTGKRLMGFVLMRQPKKQFDRVVVAVAHDEPARAVRRAEEQQKEQERRQGFGRQHPAPAGDQYPMVVALERDGPVDEIDDGDAGYDGDLLEHHEPAAHMGRGDFGDIERRQHGSDAHTDAADDAIDDERR